MNERTKWYLTRIGIPVLIAILSVTLLGSWFSSAKTWSGTSSYLDKKQENVLALTAASTSASFALSLLPDDSGTPIAEKFADLSDYFIAISVAVLFEKYLTPIAGLVTFRFLVPLAMVLLIVSFYKEERALKLQQIMVKLLIFGFVFTAVVPLSTQASKVIDSTYQSSIDQTVAEAQQNTEAAEVLRESETEAAAPAESESETEKKTVWDNITGAVGGVIDGAGNMIESAGEAAGSAVNSFTEGAKQLIADFKKVLNNMVNTIAVLIVTSCVIPVAVLLFLIWVTKILFHIDIPLFYPKKGIVHRSVDSAKSLKDGRGEE